MEEMGESRFHWADYVIFTLILAVSMGVGIFFGCTGESESRGVYPELHVQPFKVETLIKSWIRPSCALGGEFTRCKPLVGTGLEENKRDRSATTLKTVLPAWSTLLLLSVLMRPRETYDGTRSVTFVHFCFFSIARQEAEHD